jgi:hypothetical protein
VSKKIRLRLASIDHLLIPTDRRTNRALLFVVAVLISQERHHRHFLFLGDGQHHTSLHFKNEKESR